MTRGDVTSPDFAQCRRDAPANFADHWAAARERTAGMWSNQRRHRARDFRQTLLCSRLVRGGAELGNRAQQTPRVGMSWILEDFLDGRVLDLSASVHHDDPLRHFR